MSFGQGKQTWEKLKSFLRQTFGGSKFPQNSVIRDHWKNQIVFVINLSSWKDVEIPDKNRHFMIFLQLNIIATSQRGIVAHIINLLIGHKPSQLVHWKEMWNHKLIFISDLKVKMSTRRKQRWSFKMHILWKENAMS